MRNFDGILGKGESKRKGGIELEIVLLGHRHPYVRVHRLWPRLLI